MVFFGLFIDVQAQCDDLEPENSIYGYRERSGRCEGFYNSNVSGFAIQIVSLTQGTVSYAMNSNERLQIETKPLRDFDDISVRGVNFSMNRNYRLDLTVDPGSVAVVPVKDVLLPNRITPKNLGVFGFVERSGYKYYVPVVPKSTLAGTITDRNKLSLQIISNVDIKEITWRYAVSPNEMCGKYSDFLSLPKTTYSRNHPIEFEMLYEFLDGKQERFVCVQINFKAINGLEFNENIRLLIPKSVG